MLPRVWSSLFNVKTEVLGVPAHISQPSSRGAIALFKTYAYLRLQCTSSLLRRGGRARICERYQLASSHKGLSTCAFLQRASCQKGGDRDVPIWGVHAFGIFMAYGSLDLGFVSKRAVLTRFVDCRHGESLRTASMDSWSWSGS